MSAFFFENVINRLRFQKYVVAAKKNSKYYYYYSPFSHNNNDANIFQVKLLYHVLSINNNIVFIRISHTYITKQFKLNANVQIVVHVYLFQIIVYRHVSEIELKMSHYIFWFEISIGLSLQS